MPYQALPYARNRESLALIGTELSPFQVFALKNLAYWELNRAYLG